jgi:hypothetical protein
MPYELKLPAGLSGAGWKVKIRDKERLEPPHATILKGMRAWRWNLRNGRFMDDVPPARDVPSAIMELLRENLERLRREWDRMYPLNQAGDIHG